MYEGKGTCVCGTGAQRGQTDQIPPGARCLGGYELSDVDPGNQTGVTCKSRKCSQLPHTWFYCTVLVLKS